VLFLTYNSLAFVARCWCALCS